MPGRTPKASGPASLWKGRPSEATFFLQPFRGGGGKQEGETSPRCRLMEVEPADVAEV